MCIDLESHSEFAFDSSRTKIVPHRVQCINIENAGLRGEEADEILHHYIWASAKVSDFFGREFLVEDAMGYIFHNNDGYLAKDGSVVAAVNMAAASNSWFGRYVCCIQHKLLSRALVMYTN